MKLLREFFRQKAPRAGNAMPEYYRKALASDQLLVCICILVNLALFTWTVRAFLWIPAALLILAVICLIDAKKLNPRQSLLFYTLLVFLWCGWYVYAFGWGCGSQHLLVTVLVLVFFNIFEPPWCKALYFAALLIFRMLLFSWSLRHTPLYQAAYGPNIAMQLTNSLTLFIMLTLNFIRFSTGIQASERQLLINNQELSREAGTDPLTELPNRRSMLDSLESLKGTLHSEPFSVAIADIDFFKKINDTYGHNCGDYTLRQLAALFRVSAGENYRVCRWGGEEFFFFLPGKNLDEAGMIMNDLRLSVSRMALRFGDVDFSITVTVGVEENDFQSSVEEILEQADQKLYRGKMNGRNQVVI